VTYLKLHFKDVEWLFGVIDGESSVGCRREESLFLVASNVRSYVVRHVNLIDNSGKYYCS
jgi:hypothetical protein